MGRKQKVEPRTLKGFQDLLPATYLPRQWVIDRIAPVFRRYGFSPLATPAVEPLDVLLGPGGEEINKEIFRFETPEEEPVGLRFDLTVPFARLMAQYPDQLKAPFRRYAIGPVYRADKPGPGRFREFWQFDVDVAGVDSPTVDGEIVAVMCEVMAALGAPDYRALINNRKVVDALLEGCGITDGAKQKHVLRVIDKLAKVGVENVRRELGEGRIDDSGDPIPGVHLDESTIDKILNFVALEADTRRGVVQALRGSLPESKLTEQALAELDELADALDALGVDEAHAIFDPSLARGLDYYTGHVFEMTIPSAPQFGSVMGGGRYNELVERFTNRPMPGTGMSVGLDRLIAALQHLDVLPERTTPVQVLVVTMGNVPRTETLKVASELRAAGLNAEAFIASKKKMQMGNQLSHADHYGIPVAVILGEDEMNQGLVSVKDLLKGKEERADIDDREAYLAAGKTGQVTIPRAEMAALVKTLLGIATQ